MPFPHGLLSINENLVRIMYNPVHNRLGHRAVIVRIRIDSLVPAVRLKLCAENRCPVMCPSLDNLK
jgi:hypothetical protein